MIRLATTFSVFALLCSGMACSSSDSDEDHSGASSGAHASSSGSGSAETGSCSGTATSSGGSSSSSGANSQVLEAPTLDGVAKMAGALHVTWTNPAAECESIVGERKATMANGMVMEEYKVAFTVPGEADNKHDTTATDDMTYTYRLRCKSGADESPYSNELSGNPN